MFLAVISGISSYRHLLSLFGIHVFCFAPIKICISIIITIQNLKSSKKTKTKAKDFMLRSQNQISFKCVVECLQTST